MKIIIEENPVSKWIFDTECIENDDLKKNIEYHVNEILKPMKDIFSKSVTTSIILSGNMFTTEIKRG